MNAFVRGGDRRVNSVRDGGKVELAGLFRSKKSIDKN